MSIFEGKKHSSYGNGAIALTIIGFVAILIAFSTSYWVTVKGPNDTSVGHAGIWKACVGIDFSSSRRVANDLVWQCLHYYSADMKDPIPDYLVQTQALLTICFVLSLVGAALACLYHFRFDVRNDRYVTYVYGIALVLFVSGIFGIAGISIYTSNVRSKGGLIASLMPFGWSYGLAWTGIWATLIAAALFFKDGYDQKKN